VKRYVGTFFRHKRLYLVSVLIMLSASGVGTYYFSFTAYEARTRIWVDKPVLPNILDQNTQTFGIAPSPAQEQADKLFQLVQADSFMSTVIVGTAAGEQLTGEPDRDRELFAKIRSKLAVGVAGQNTLTISFKDKNPLLCQQVVQGVVDQFLKWNLQSQIDQSSLELQFFQKQLEIYDQRVKDIQQSLDTFYTQFPNPEPGSPQNLELQRLQRELESARGIYSAATTRVAQAGFLGTLTENNQNAKFQILDKATVPELPAATLSSLARFFGIGVGASIGGLLAIIAVVTWLDTVVRSAEDLQRLVDVSVLAVVPDVQQAGRITFRGMSRREAVSTPTNAAAELLAVERSFLRQWMSGEA
jgi:uncharacterized protein involved in exopolysaccharide biosynthesis